MYLFSSEHTVYIFWYGFYFLHGKMTTRIVSLEESH